MSREAPQNDAIGVIDIGSNSVRLLVANAADKRTEIVFTDMITSRLLSKATNGVLNESSIERTARAIESLIDAARSHGAKNVLAFGTCAMREGKNSRLLVDWIKTRKGVDIEILSGTEEAAIAYMGVAKSGKNGIIDIGGGSTELTVGEDESVLRCASAPVGAVRLCEAYISASPETTLERAREILSPAWETVKSESPSVWTGVGGTITTLAAMSLELEAYDAEKISRFILTREKAREWFDRLYKMPVEERKALPGIKANRADIIPFGAAVLAAFFELSKAESISVADNDNMLGYLRLRKGLA